MRNKCANAHKETAGNHRSFSFSGTNGTAQTSNVIASKQQGTEKHRVIWLKVAWFNRYVSLGAFMRNRLYKNMGARQVAVLQSQHTQTKTETINWTAGTKINRQMRVEQSGLIEHASFIDNDIIRNACDPTSNVESRNHAMCASIV